jgi:hypothetical protein
VLGGDALGLVAEKDDGRLRGGRQARQRDGVVGEFDGEDLPPGLALKANPAVLTVVDPVDAAAPSQASRVPDGERLAVVRGVGDRDAGAGRIAGAQQGAEVGLVGDPERGDDVVLGRARPSPGLARDTSLSSAAYARVGAGACTTRLCSAEVAAAKRTPLMLPRVVPCGGRILSWEAVACQHRQRFGSPHRMRRKPLSGPSSWPPHGQSTTVSWTLTLTRH